AHCPPVPPNRRRRPYLLRTGNLGVMSAVADEVSVMKDGLVVETGPRARVLREPGHAYTRSLLDSLPDTELT
ncbi:hypothetical protein AB0M50_54885, partial [Nonomuraea fuscirosea]